MEPHLRLTRAQMEFISTPATELWFIGGLGAGKTAALALFILTRAVVPGSVGLLAAPTYKVMSRSTWPGMQKTLALCGLHPDVDYVMHSKPPPGWNVPPFSAHSSNNIVTFRWGSYLLLSGLHDPDSLRGIEVDYIGVDEFRDIPDDSLDVLLPRLRGKCFRELGRRSQIGLVSTPPESVTEIRRLQTLADGDNRAFIFSPTADNAPNLPNGYVETLRGRLDELTFRREVLGELVDDVDNRYIYAFTLDRNVGVCEWQPELPVYLSFDFNVQPGVVLAFQHDRTSQWIHQVGEVVVKKADIWEMCERVQAAYPGATFHVTGDASGNARSIMQRGNATAYDVIRKQLNVPPSRFSTPISNAHHRDSRVLCNCLYATFPTILIDHRCHVTIEDLLTCAVDKDGAPDKSDAMRTHALDANRYYLQTYWHRWIDVLSRNKKS